VYEATCGRLFAAGYDRLLAGTEEAGLRERRRELLAGATGDVLELGAGTGANLAIYPDGLGRLVLTEPGPHMASRLRARVAATGSRAEVVAAGAESLPFAESSFDTVVSTLVLCTVENPDRTALEVVRVLRPGGRLLFLEHVRSSEPGIARWQDRLERPWRFVGAGCRCNRDTLTTIRGAGLEVEAIEHGALPKAPQIVRPLVVGSARAA